MTGRLSDFIDWVDGTYNYEKELIDRVALYNEIVIFGAGIGGAETLKLLSEKKIDYKVVAFSDNNKEKLSKGEYLKYPVISPNNIKEKTNNALILISSTAYNVIVKQLILLGLKKENIIYFQPAGMSLERNKDREFIESNINKLEKVYAMLADEKSKKIYTYILNYRISKNICWLERMEKYIDEEDTQYFDQNILASYSFEKGFVDGGAYLGDTLERFYKYFPNWEGSYYCIEAGKDIYLKMCEKVKKLHRKNIETYEYALWDSGGTLYFDTKTFGAGAGSHVSNSGESVMCITLDNLLMDKSVDFIKMDIEGAEKKALIGAQKIIKKNKPVLAICIYHRPEDFYSIPFLINEILEGEYKFYVRQYRYGQSETVLYAMPISRRL